MKHSVLQPPSYSLETEAEDIAPLNQPGRIGSMDLRNRFVQSPIFTQFASADGEVTQRMIDYYRARARGGIGLMITENTTVDWSVGRSVGHPIRIDHDRYISGLADLVEAMHAEGVKLAVQLHHTGRQNSSGGNEGGRPPVAPTAGITSAFGSPPRELNIDEIPQFIEHYVNGARRAVAAGFDAIEIHGAHGYLPQQFLSPKTNKRTDAYGGDLANRGRFALELIAAIRAVVPAGYPIMYRMSVEEPYEGGLQLEEGLEFARLIAPLVDAIDVTSGNYDTAGTLLPTRISGSLLHHAAAVKNVVDVPVIGVGRLAWRLQDCAAAVRDGDVDFIAFGRSGLADPDMVNKINRGESSRVRRCIAVNECVSRWMFAAQTTKCVINPALSREGEAERARQPITPAKTVAVVGAGPAGCEAAILAAERGHRVVLFERSDRIGGQLQAWAESPVMQTEIRNLIQFYESELGGRGVRIELGVEPNEGTLSEFDAVVLATGTRSGASEGQRDAIDMLRAAAVPEAEHFIVDGETEVGVHAALWLADKGKRVTLYAPQGVVAADGNDMLRIDLEADLVAAGVEVTAELSAGSGAEMIWAGHREPTADMQDLVDEVTVFAAGTRHRGGRLYEATQSGFWTAARI